MKITRGRGRVIAGLLAAGLALLVGLAGCSADGGSDDSANTSGAGYSGGQADAPAGDPERAPAGAAPGEGTAEDKAGTPGRYQTDERSIIYTGSITVRLEKDGDLDAKAAQAIALVTAAGGFVGSDQRSSADGRAQASLELRVPAARFAQLVDDLSGLGDEESRQLGTRDVTEDVVDLDARIATQQASVNRTRALLAQAKSVAELVSVEGELAKREAELASLQAKKRRLADLTSLSTITLMLLGPDVEATEEEPETGFIAGLKAGWKALLVAFTALKTVVGALLPWAVAVGVPVLAVILVLRWRRRVRPAPPTS